MKTKECSANAPLGQQNGPHPDPSSRRKAPVHALRKSLERGEKEKKRFALDQRVGGEIYD